MINAEELRLTDEEATTAAYGHKNRYFLNPAGLRKRRGVIDAQLSKALWNIVDQLRTNGTGDEITTDDLIAAAILEHIALLANLPHPTTQFWFEVQESPRIYVQTADPVVVRELQLEIPMVINPEKGPVDPALLFG